MLTLTLLVAAFMAIQTAQGQTTPSLHSNNAGASGLWGNDDTIWVVNDGVGANNEISAYQRSDGMHDSAKDFNALKDSPPQNHDAGGACSDGTRMFVVDFDEDTVYGYDLFTKVYDSSKEIPLHGDNGEPHGLWCNATTIWVDNDGTGAGNKIFAHKLTARATSGCRAPSRPSRRPDCRATPTPTVASTATA